MNRWNALLTSLGCSLLLHALLVLGAVWFWTLRRVDLRPIFQTGEISLAVTFVKAEDGLPAEAPWAKAGGQRTEDDGRQRTEDDGRQTTEDRQQTADDGRQTTEELKTEDGLPAEAPWAKAGGQTAEDGERKTENEPVAAFSQGVNAAERMQSEIRPYYPIGARLRGEEGAVTLRVAISDSGRLLRCEVAQSSGYPALDTAAMDAARRAQYVSTQAGVRSAESETLLTFRFKLTE